MMTCDKEMVTRLCMNDETRNRRDPHQTFSATLRVLLEEIDYLTITHVKRATYMHSRIHSKNFALPLTDRRAEHGMWQGLVVQA